MTTPTLERIDTALCSANPELWESVDTAGRTAAAQACLSCPLLQSCARQLRDRIAAGQTPTAIVQAGVAFDIAGGVDPDVHGAAGAARIAGAFALPVGEGGIFGGGPDPCDDLPELSADQLRDALAELDA